MEQRLVISPPPSRLLIAPQAALFSIFLLLGPARPSWAILSASPSFTHARSSLNGAGQVQSSANYSLDSALGEVAFTTGTSADYLSRAGLIPIYYYPSQVAGLTASACTPGQLFLNWNAPGNDAQAPRTTAKAYLVKLSTDPALNPALSATLFAQASAAPGAPPSPALQGTTQAMLLSGLTNGTTYYLAVLALEADGTPGPSAAANTKVALTGPSLAAFTAATGFRRSLLAWSALGSVGGAACNPNDYVVSRATSATAAFQTVAATTGTSLADANVQVASTYYYQLDAVNVYDQVISSSSVRLVWVRTEPTLPPLRPSVSLAGSNATVSWEAPTAFDFGVPFDNPAAPRSDELTGFRVWRSTAPTMAPWTLLATVSTGTSRYTDPAGQAGDYYKVTAVNATEESRFAFLADTSQNASMPSWDQLSQLVLPPGAVPALSPGSSGGYWILASSQTGTSGSSVQDTSPTSTIYTASRFDIMRGTSPVTASISFPVPAQVRLSYAPGALLSSSPPSSPEQTSLYWDNGAKWVKLYGRLDGLNRYLAADVERAGSFQLRSLERTSDFNFNAAGLSNKFLTPNGDNLNDKVVFTFDNPRDSQITGRIYDLKGALVAELAMTSQFTMVWDGKANGQRVPGGVYIYQLEGDGRVFNGTLVVIR